MKVRIIIIVSLLLPAINGCKPGVNCSLMLNRISQELYAGNFDRVHILADSLSRLCPGNNSVRKEADSLDRIADRTKLDFCLTEEVVTDQIRRRSGNFSPGDIKKWEEKGWLEYRIINGEKMYFRRAVSNLFLLKSFYEENERRQKEAAEDPEMISRLENTSEAYKLSLKNHNPVLPVEMKITYTITVHPDAVPDGEILRCWMPWPKAGHPRQSDIKILGTSSPKYFISPDSAIHSTIYMEAASRKGSPAKFTVTFQYQSEAQYFNFSDLTIIPYDRNSELYKRYTSEQAPQIRFTENVRSLADSISGPVDNPAETVRKIYMWFKKNIPWTGALEYSIMPDIPGYVCRNRRGDCGMQTFLYISMLRYKGIPARWQSGWMVPPGHENLHDWAEVYFEGTGWVPSDVSYDLQNSEERGLREYFLSGIDSYRMIINDGVAGPLYPAKIFMRSEPYDFQRGEVEWKGGNLYFDKWDYDIEIEYLNH